VKKEITGCPRRQWEDELLGKGGWNSLYKPIHLTSLEIIIIIIIIIIKLKIICGPIHVLSYSVIVLSVGAIFAASVLVMRIIRSLYYQIIVSSYEPSYALMTSEVFLSNYVAKCLTLNCALLKRRTFSCPPDSCGGPNSRLPKVLRHLATPCGSHGCYSDIHVL
jgi:hypothetical protein